VAPKVRLETEIRKALGAAQVASKAQSVEEAPLTMAQA
jgi:hypothetical protein